MQEDLLHCIWKHKKFNFTNLRTTVGEELVLLEMGQHNVNSGPDFFNARVVIGDQEWAGNVEIHINSSDWYVHRHEIDVNYDNVILHVVWNHNSDVFRKDNSAIPVLELKEYISAGTLNNYRELLEGNTEKWINCEKDFYTFDDFIMNNWLERLYFERLEEKSTIVFRMLEESSNNWEEVLFRMMAKNFGLNINGDPFLSMANSIPFSVVRKLRNEQGKLESLFLGQAGLLEGSLEEIHYQNLQKDYKFLKQKFKLKNEGLPKVKFFRLRPDNFPTLRLAQLATLYNQPAGLFSEIISSSTIKEFYKIMEINLSAFWQSHYSFQKKHKRRRKDLSKHFIDLLIVNTFIPLKFCYASKQGKEVNEEIINLISSLSSESNSIIKKFNQLRPATARNALQSQGLLQLKQHYCDKNKCLKCRMGIKLLHREAQI